MRDGKFIKGKKSCNLVLVKLNVNFCSRKHTNVDIKRSEFFLDLNFSVADAKGFRSHRKSIEIVDELLETLKNKCFIRKCVFEIFTNFSRFFASFNASRRSFSDRGT